MNQHPIYMTAGSPRDVSSPHSRVLETLAPAEVSTGAFQPLSFHPQTTTYYSPAPTTFHTNSNTAFISQERKNEYLIPTTMLSASSSDVLSQGSIQSRLPALSSSLAGSSEGGMLSTPSLSITKEHPAVVQADQMNAFMDTYFVDHEASTSADTGVGEVDDHDLDKSVMIDIPPLTEDDKRITNAELARIRYPRMPADEKHLANQRRAEDIKRKRQRERERKELDDILRDSHDVDDDQLVVEVEKIREQRSKQRRAEAARSRYQRMSEAERRAYNQRRRLRALGLDPDCPKGQIDGESVKEHIKMANAKKAEAARLRYHRMSLEEKRQYNQRRTESFRKRRLEEEILLSTPAGRISADALQKAQQIMIRNARKAEAARARYQKMTAEQRKDYNTRRAQAKKLRAVARGGTPGMMSSDCSIVSGGDLSESGGLGTSFQSDPSNLLEEQTDSSHSLPPIVQSQHASDDIFQQMERDVIKRTKQAHMALARQQQTSQSQSLQIHSGSTFTSSVHDSQLLGGDTVLITNDGHLINQEKVYVQQSQLIDEKALHQMLLTGHDANGQPVELRTVDGTPIRGEEQLRAITNGQPILIHPQPPIHLTAVVEESNKNNIYSSNGERLHLVPTTTSISMQSSQPLYASHEVVIDDIPNPIRYRNTASESQSATDILAEATAAATMTVAQRHELSKARRAERARLRYHSMQPEVRQQQNAKRAELLRKSRQRDDELCHLAETCQLESLDEETRRAISEAQSRRARRAEQARAKYHRMNSEERRQYNAMRDAQRRQRKREQEARAREQVHMTVTDDTVQVESSLSPGGHGGGSLSPSASVEQGQQIIYSTYEMYQEPMGSWEQ